MGTAFARMADRLRSSRRDHAAKTGTRATGPAPGTRKHRGRKRNLFPLACTLVAALVLLFVGSAIAAIVLGGVSHFGEAITSAEVLFSLRMSVVTATISTAICLALSLPTAYCFTHVKFPGKRAAEVLMELTLSLPYILLGFALLLIFSSPFGKALKEAGFAVVFSPAGIVLAQIMVNLPFAIRMMRTAFAEVNPRLEFVAQTLGAMPWDVFRTVILPLCSNSIISAFVLTWARGMGEFGATLMLVGVTRMKTETLPGSIYLSISTGNTEAAMATAMIMLLVSALTLVVANALNAPRTRFRVGESAAGKGAVPSGATANGQAAASAVSAEASDAGALTHAASTVTQPSDSFAHAQRGAAQPAGAFGTTSMPQPPGGSIRVRNLLATRGSFSLRVPSLDVQPGQVFAIVGRTGSGKTVLLESIAGAFPLQQGAIELDGKSTATLPIQQRRLGVVYQDHALLPHLTVRENIRYGLNMNGVPAEEADRRVANMLELFGISSIADQFPGVISGGEAQRTALARALVLRPSILLLDEPFSALDPVTKQRMHATLREINRVFGCTVVFVTHDFSEAAQLADQVAIVLDGQLQAVCASDNLMTGAFSPQVMEFLGRATA